jgi:HlyD family secretion protein
MKRWILPICLILALGGLIVWRLAINAKATEAQAQTRTQRQHAKPLVTVVPATYKDMRQTFEAVGNVDSPLTVKIGPKYAGQVATVDVHEGDHVASGQIVATIDPAEAQANVDEQQGNVAQAQEKLAQAQLTQNANDVGVMSTIAQDRATLNGAIAALNSANKNYISMVAAAEGAVVDGQAKVAAAISQVANGKAGLNSAQASQVDAQAKYNREDSLFKQGYVAAQDRDDDQAALSVAVANVDVAQGQLDAANSALNSSQAELKEDEDELKTTRTSAKSTVNAATSTVVEDRAILATALANSSQQPAYIANLRALQAAVVAAQAQLHDARVQLQYTVLTSPIDGFVTARLMDPGTQAVAGQEILEIQTVNPVWITAPVPEEESDEIRVGQTGDISLDALPNVTFTGRVSQINASADPSNRQFSVRVTIDNPKALIKPGMFARVDFLTSFMPHQLYVPREAISTSTGGPSTAFVVGPDGVVQQRTVVVASSDTDGFAISSGILPGENVVTLSAMPLRDGQSVRIAGPGGGSGAGGGKHHHHQAG